MNLDLRLLAIGATLLAPSLAAAEPPVAVVDVARSFPDGGGYRWEDGTGSPREIVHDGATILAAQPKGTYCCGFTFAVAMRAAEERGLLAGKTPEEVRRFQKQWYGAATDSAEKQCALAVEELGVGREVAQLDDAQPGDFVQIWRTNKTGHSVVLIELVRDDANRTIGLRYRSSQKSTDGIGDRTEYFADVAGRDGAVDRRRTYVSRLFNARP